MNRITGIPIMHILRENIHIEIYWSEIWEWSLVGPLSKLCGYGLSPMWNVHASYKKLPFLTYLVLYTLSWTSDVELKDKQFYFCVSSYDTDVILSFKCGTSYKNMCFELFSHSVYQDLSMNAASLKCMTLYIQEYVSLTANEEDL